MPVSPRGDLAGSPVKRNGHHTRLAEPPSGALAECQTQPMHLELFSDPVWGLGGKPGIRLDEGGRAVAYDEELLKPAILLADKVTLRTHRLDVRKDAQIEARKVRLAVPVAAKIDAYTSDGAWWITGAAGLDDLLAELADAAASHRDADGRIDISIVQTDVAQEFARRLYSFYRTTHDEFTAKKFEPLRRSGVLTELPWDLRDYTKFSPVEAAIENRENAFHVGFADLLSRIEESPDPLMIDAGIGERLEDVAGVPTPASSVLFRNAVDLLRTVDAISAAPIDAVIDVRDELQEHLAPFRRFILDLSGDLAIPADVSPGERQRTLAVAWDTRVAPAVDELKAHVQARSFAKNLFRVGLDKSEANLAVGMAIVGAAGANALGIATLAGAAVGALPSLIGAAKSSVEARGQAKSKPAYFIYEVAKRLQARTPTR